MQRISESIFVLLRETYFFFKGFSSSQHPPTWVVCRALERHTDAWGKGDGQEGRGRQH